MPIYADVEDLFAFGAPREAFRGVSIAALQAQLDVASKRAMGYLANEYDLPLTPLDPPPELGQPYPEELKEAVAKIAAYGILSVRGYDPEADGGALKDRATDAVTWLQDVGAGRTSPPDLRASSSVGLLPGPSGTLSSAGGPWVATDAARWGRPLARASRGMPDYPNLGSVGPSNVEGDDDGWTT